MANAAAPAAIDAKAKADVYFGLVFELQGENGTEEIVLEPKTAVTNIQKYGIECTLPKRVSLGTGKSVIDTVLNSVGSNMNNIQIKEKVDEAKISALSGVYEKVSSAVLNIEQFHIKIPGSIEKEAATKKIQTELDEANAKSPQDNNLIAKLQAELTKATPVTKYTVGVSATWPKESGSATSSSDLPGTLTLRGIYLTVSNEMPAPIPDAPVQPGQ